MPLVTATINNPAIALEKRFREVDFVARGLALAAQAIQSAGQRQHRNRWRRGDRKLGLRPTGPLMSLQPPKGRGLTPCSSSTPPR
jgi:hypothetical protein